MCWYTSPCGRVELQITLAQAEMGSHPGPCDLDIKALRSEPKIARQLKKIDPEALRRELREVGDFGPEELQDHDANLSRILWVACAEITEQKALRH